MGKGQFKTYRSYINIKKEVISMHNYDSAG